MSKELNTAYLPPFTTPSVISLELEFLERELEPYWSAHEFFTHAEMKEYFGPQPSYQKDVRTDKIFGKLCDTIIRAEHRIKRAANKELSLDPSIPF